MNAKNIENNNYFDQFADLFAKAKEIERESKKKIDGIKAQIILIIKGDWKKIRGVFKQAFHDVYHVSGSVGIFISAQNHKLEITVLGSSYNKRIGLKIEHSINCYLGDDGFYGDDLREGEQKYIDRVNSILRGEA